MAWGAPVHFFATKVKQSSEFSKAAHRHRFAAFTDELKPSFTALMEELETRIGDESKRLATIPA
jgi:hypothetical protein